MYIHDSDFRSFGLTFLDNIIEWVRDNYAPEDIYSEDELREWAFDNGFVDD